MNSPAVSLTGVTVLRNGRPIVDDVSIEIMTGEHWALLGPNGSGKSTLMSVISGDTLPSRGAAYIFGHRRGTVELSETKRDISYISNHHGLEWPMTALDIVLTAYTNTLELPMRWEPTTEQVDTAREMLMSCGLTEVMTTTWRALSQGELSRTFLARAAVKKPRLLLLDEPASGLDIAARELLLDTIDSLVTTVPQITSVLVTHHLEEIPASTTHIAMVKAGHIVGTGSVSEILTTERMTSLYGLPVDVSHRDGRWSARAQR